MDEHVMDLLRVFFKRCVQIKFIFSAQSLKDRTGKAVLICARLPSQNGDRSLIDR